MRKALLHLNHALMHSLLKPDMIVCDMTCGQGYDTEWMAPHVKKVFAFDIQAQALDIAKKRLSHLHNITYIHASFEKVFDYTQEASLYVFNLGYLPGSDKTIKTTKSVTIKTIQTITSQTPQAHILMMVYIGHDEGMKEYIAIKHFIETLHTHQVIQSDVLMKDQAPIMIWIIPK